MKRGHIWAFLGTIGWNALFLCAVVRSQNFSPLVNVVDPQASGIRNWLLKNQIRYSEFDGQIWLLQDDFRPGMFVDQMQPYRVAIRMAREGIRADRYAFERLESSFDQRGDDSAAGVAIAHQIATADLISKRIAGRFPSIYWCKSMIVQRVNGSRSYLSLGVWSHDLQPLAQEDIRAISESAIAVAHGRSISIDEVIIWDNKGRYYWPENPNDGFYLVPDVGDMK